MANLTSNPVAKVFASLPLAIAACFVGLPSQAATLAESIGGFSFSSFSSAPLFTDSTALTSSFTSGEGSVAIADSGARFDAFPDVEASNFVDSSAFTTSDPSIAFAKSDASILGDFAVNAGETFSFDFTGFASLLTSVDEPGETASAFYETKYTLFQSDINVDNGTPIDSFGILGVINTPDGEDLLSIDQSSDAITLSALDVVEATGEDLLEEAILVDTAGRYERLFETPSILTLVEFKVSVAESKTQVPDASNTWLGLLGVGSVLLVKRYRTARNVLS